MSTIWILNLPVLQSYISIFWSILILIGRWNLSLFQQYHVVGRIPSANWKLLLCRILNRKIVTKRMKNWLLRWDEYYLGLLNEYFNWWNNYLKLIRHIEPLIRAWIRSFGFRNVARHVDRLGLVCRLKAKVFDFLYVSNYVCTLMQSYGIKGR